MYYTNQAVEQVRQIMKAEGIGEWDVRIARDLNNVLWAITIYPKNKED